MCFSKGGIIWRFVIKICLIKRSTEVIRTQWQNFFAGPSYELTQIYDSDNTCFWKYVIYARTFQRSIWFNEETKNNRCVVISLGEKILSVMDTLSADTTLSSCFYLPSEKRYSKRKEFSSRVACLAWTPFEKGQERKQKITKVISLVKWWKIYHVYQLPSEIFLLMDCKICYQGNLVS